MSGEQDENRWRQADKDALQSVARAAREAASAEGVSEGVAHWLEVGAERMLSRIPAEEGIDPSHGEGA